MRFVDNIKDIAGSALQGLAERQKIEKIGGDSVGCHGRSSD